MTREPVVWTEAIRLVLTDALALLIGIGVLKLTQDQAILVLAVVNSVLGLISAVSVRSRVSPVGP